MSFWIRMITVFALAALCETSMISSMQAISTTPWANTDGPWLFWEHAPLQITINLAAAVVFSIVMTLADSIVRARGSQVHLESPLLPGATATWLLPVLLVAVWFFTAMFTPTSPDPGQGSGIVLFGLGPVFLGWNLLLVELARLALRRLYRNRAPGASAGE